MQPQRGNLAAKRQNHSIWIIAIFVALVLQATAFAGEGMKKMEKQSQRYQKGIAVLDQLNAEAARQVRAGLQDIAPEMADFIVEFAYGDVYSRPGLDVASRQMATVAALTALGYAAPQLEFHIGAALNAGVTPREVIEVIYVTTVYAGFPAGLNAINVARKVFSERGVPVADAPEAAGSRRERGLAALAHTSGGSGQAVLDSLADVAPEMGEFILDFSYGDVFSRTGISDKYREIAAIAATTAAGTMLPQLKVHIAAGLNVGLKPKEVVEVIDQMAVYAGFPAALNGLGAAREVFTQLGVQRD